MSEYDDYYWKQLNFKSWLFGVNVVWTRAEHSISIHIGPFSFGWDRDIWIIH